MFLYGVFTYSSLPLCRTIIVMFIIYTNIIKYMSNFVVNILISTFYSTILTLLFEMPSILCNLCQNVSIIYIIFASSCLSVLIFNLRITPVFGTLFSCSTNISVPFNTFANHFLLSRP